MRVLYVHIRFLVLPEAVQITHITLYVMGRVPVYTNSSMVFIRNNKNKTIIRVNNNRPPSKTKYNLVYVFSSFDRGTSLLLKWAVGPLWRPFTQHILAHFIQYR